ncbi:alpha-beta hydrolase superfamily lysophospholipase [Geodermatophilus tzadiensis]|uniref:Alpha-beta hydrolase superfamily lysophospholipase n=1 Tax=Geodermatophilus tzadiensis TaxID=1137988 RepID=A0A2T0TP65_9ACTN|nr:alpha/beta fold hydrolase [Geodermatophilus tzadiensis]PRY47431.1 alpha-beta hydrolase superfamily lysophospholipase [Geodermatophilus tzadiensis]
MTSNPPSHVVLVHGLWVTPRSWEHWVPHYEARGMTVHTPGYPGFDIEVEALRENPDLIADLTVPETLDHLASVITALATPPIVIGHSFGGTLTQLLLARGLGAAGVVIDSAPTEGVRVNPLSQVRSLFPALRNPANRHRAVGFTPEEWHYAFTNTLTAEESRAAWDRYAIAAPGHWVWEYGLFANLKPGHQDTWVDYAADRVPLLFIAGGEDHIMPPSVNRSNARHYERSPAVTEYHEFEGRDHWTCAAPGWEAVADHALEWALAHAAGSPRPAPTTA